MFLGNALTSAASGLDSINKQLAIVSQNVANTGTPGYARETLPLSTADSGGQAIGVRTGVATRVMDTQLQGDLMQAVGTEAGTQVTQAALQAVDQVSGAPGSGQDLPSLLGALRDAFSQLATDPSNATQQRSVVDRAQSVVDGLHTLGSGLLKARQAAQDSLAQEVTSANAALRSIGQLSDQIILGKARGESTAALEDQRDTQMRSVAQLTGARFVPQANGDVLATAGNASLSLRADTGPFSLGSVTFAPDTPAALVPALKIGVVPAGGLGGQMGANLALRDTTLPGLQSDLDGFANALAGRFSGAGLTLLTDATGAVPAAGTVGSALTIQVAAAVQATPSMVRDGATPSGAAGDATLVNAVLDGVLNTGSGTLTGQATSLIANHAQLASEAAARASTDTAVRTSLESKLSGVTGVSVDSEMSTMIRLQNAYAANAKVVAAVQDMWTQLLAAVR